MPIAPASIGLRTARKLRVEAAVEADHQRRLLLRDHGEAGAHALGVEVDRLLAEDRLAGLGAPARSWSAWRSVGVVIRTASMSLAPMMASTSGSRRPRRRRAPRPPRGRRRRRRRGARRAPRRRRRHAPCRCGRRREVRNLNVMGYPFCRPSRAVMAMSGTRRALGCRSDRAAELAPRAPADPCRRPSGSAARRW